MRGAGCSGGCSSTWKKTTGPRAEGNSSNSRARNPSCDGFDQDENPVVATPIWRFFFFLVVWPVVAAVLVWRAAARLGRYRLGRGLVVAGWSQPFFFLGGRAPLSNGRSNGAEGEGGPGRYRLSVDWLGLVASRKAAEEVLRLDQRTRQVVSLACVGCRRVCRNEGKLQKKKQLPPGTEYVQTGRQETG